jgi:hypothetical protein
MNERRRALFRRPSDDQLICQLPGTISWPGAISSSFVVVGADDPVRPLREHRVVLPYARATMFSHSALGQEVVIVHRS